jgi:predicted GIY-YIG superfamily endonuclease
MYRIFDADDALLYVGVTTNGMARLQNHRSVQEWWPRVARIEIEHLPTWSAAEATLLEAEAIRTEQPMYNQLGTWRVMQCGHCGTEFKYQRSTRVYCSTKCKNAAKWHRSRSA